MASTLRGRSLVLLPEDGRLAVRAGFPPEDRLDDKARAAADWAWANAQPAGRGSATLPTSDWLFLPLKTGRGPVGVLGVQIEAAGRLLSPEESRLLDTLADQAALAIERTNLVADIEHARLATETERLRSALLSSLSHDLRTPLVSILGAASSLVSYEGTLKPADRLELAQTIQEEAERLNRFVQNLLDMTRLGSGQLRPRTDWVDLRDIVASAIERAKKLLRRRTVKVEIDPAVPLLRTLGQHSYAIFLHHMFFQAAVRILLMRLGADDWQIFLLATAGGCVGPMVLQRLASVNPWTRTALLGAA